VWYTHLLWFHSFVRFVWQSFGALDTSGTNLHLPVSPSDVRNSLLLCANCDKAFEQHHIEILANGALEYNEGWLKSLPEIRAKKYRALRAVPWAHHIDKNKNYPTSAVLRPRCLFPAASSAGAREFRAYLKELAPDAEVPPEDGKPEDDDEEEEQPKKKQRKTKGKASGGKQAQVSHTLRAGNSHCRVHACRQRQLAASDGRATPRRLHAPLPIQTWQECRDRCPIRYGRARGKTCATVASCCPSGRTRPRGCF
jgi:hypothetical protein